MANWWYRLSVMTPGLWLGLVAIVGLASFFLVIGVCLWRRRVIRSLLVAVLLVLLALNVAWVLGSVGHAVLAQRATAQVSGRVVAVQQESTKYHRHHSRVTLRYRVAGNDYRVTTQFSGWGVQVGDARAVRYIPGHAGQASIGERPVSVLGVLMAGFADVLALAACWGIWRYPILVDEQVQAQQGQK